MRESRFYLFHLTFCTVVMRYFCIPWNPNMNQNRLVVFLNCISFLMYLRNSINEEQIKPFYQLCLYSIILGWGLKLLSDSGFHSSLSHSNFFHNLVHILLEKGWTPLKLPLLPISLLLPFSSENPTLQIATSKMNGSNFMKWSESIKNFLN